MTQETLRRVVDCIATTTRYPIQLLVSDADLEIDLGIDSVKRVEIVIALGEEFGIESQTAERDPAIRTIGDVAGWIDGLLASSTLHHVEERNFDRPAPQASRVHQHSSRTASQTTQAPRYAAINGSCGEPAISTKPLAGRVALVTGSGRGIGQTIARVLASRGATIVVNSFHSREQGEQTVSLINEQGGTAVHVWGSIAKPSHVNDIFSKIEQRFGHLDILVCNASDGRIGSFLEITSEDWDRAFRTNVSGHHQCAIRAAQLMRPRGGGSIVTLSAVGAHHFVDGLGSQGVVKAAVESLTRYLACELGPHGVRVNCVAGGPVYGDLLSKFPESSAVQNHWESLAPDNELSSPMDLAQTIAFLVSAEARGVNGAIWTVDHGFSAQVDDQSLNRASQRAVPAAAL